MVLLPLPVVKMLKKLGLILHCIFVPIEYSTDPKGRLLVREYFKKPVDLLDHLRQDHNLSESEINEIYLAARRGYKMSHAGDNMDPLDYL